MFFFFTELNIRPGSVRHRRSRRLRSPRWSPMRRFLDRLRYGHLPVHLPRRGPHLPPECRHLMQVIKRIVIKKKREKLNSKPCMCDFERLTSSFFRRRINSCCLFWASICLSWCWINQKKKQHFKESTVLTFKHPKIFYHFLNLNTFSG